MKTLTSNNSVYDITIRLFILFLIIAWCLLIMYPFVSILLWSLILAMALYPLHKIISTKIGGKPKWASFIIVFSILAVVFVPTFFLVGSLIDEVKELKLKYDVGTLNIPPPTEKVKEWPLIGEKLFEFWQSISFNLDQTLIKYQDQLLEVGSNLAKGILSALGGVIQIMVALIIAGVLLVFGGLGESIRKIFRKLADNRGDDFANTTMKTVANVVKGVLGVAFIVALLIGILLMLAGIPYAGILTLIVFVLAVLQLPVLFVTIPIIVYLFAVKEPLPAIVYTVLLILTSMSDNILRPILLGKGAPVPMIVIFIGVIGGFIFSGFIGLFTGAIVMSIGYKLFVGWINSDNEIEKI